MFLLNLIEFDTPNEVGSIGEHRLSRQYWIEFQWIRSGRSAVCQLTSRMISIGAGRWYGGYGEKDIHRKNQVPTKD